MDDWLVHGLTNSGLVGWLVAALLYSLDVIFQISPEEQLKIRRRRERNKMAAWRCREKKKQRLDDLERVSTDLI